jgi:CheY-like chemotaxis protein
MSAEGATALTILLVQPKGDTLDLYAEYLRARGQNCIPLSDAAAALPAVAAADVVVTGILLPGSADGVELITKIRASERSRRVPIIVLTACAFESERLRAQAAGCDAFLSKPCLPSDLYDEIERQIGDLPVGKIRARPAKAHGGDASTRRRKSGERGR